MFERFTDRARRVIVLAQDEARMFDHNYIGTEHILLGLIQESEGVAAKALANLGIEIMAVRTQVEEIIGRGGETPTGHVPFTARSKQVLELSLREALQLGHNYVGTEHLLLGLVREGQGIAAQVLVSLGAELPLVRHAVITVLGGHKPPPLPLPPETVDFWDLVEALGEALSPHDSVEYWQVVARLTRKFPQFDWHNAMTDGGR